jgi:hypothetical protein
MSGETSESSTAPARSLPPAVLPALVALLVALELLLVWSHPRLPSNDGPAHQYSAWVAHRLAADPGGPLATWFQPNPRPVYPNLAYDLFLEALADRIPGPTAEKAGASLYLLALPLAVGLFVRSLGRDPWLPVLAAVGLSLNLIFFLGFFNFLWGVPLGFVCLICVGRAIESPRVVRLAASNVLFLLTFLTHLVAFAVACAGAGALALAAGRRRMWWGLAAFVPAALLTPMDWPRSVSWKAHLDFQRSLPTRLLDVGSLQIASAFDGAERVLAIAVGVPLLAWCTWALTRRRAPGVGSLRALVLTFAALAVVAPSGVGSGSFLTERLILYVWLALICAAEARGRAARAAAAALLAVATIAHLGYLEGRFRAFDREMGVYLSAESRLPPGARLFAYTEVPPHRDFVAYPMATVHCYYHRDLGAPNFRDYQAALPDARYFPVRYTAAAKERYTGDAVRGRLPLPRFQPWADFVLTWKVAPTRLRHLVRAGGYRLEYRQGPLALFGRAAAPLAPVTPVAPGDPVAPAAPPDAGPGG